jgi:drug/metabolite transporter (DMT)-like permease
VTAAALALVLVAAFAHAGWNYLLKRSGGGIGFVWLFAAVSALLYAPIAFGTFLWLQPNLGWPHIAAAAASAALHTVYYLLLDRGYRRGDLSLVYPVARATGPLLTVGLAMLLLGERPAPLAFAGALLISTGGLLLTGDPRALRRKGIEHAVLIALATGVAIAAYTVVDKTAVALLLTPPILQDWMTNVGRVALMTPLLRTRGASVYKAWREHRRDVLAVAVLCPLSYILVLTAMQLTLVSYVAPAREVSILIAALLGARLLSERDARRRGIAAALMTMGVVALALA